MKNTVLQEAIESFKHKKNNDVFRTIYIESVNYVYSTIVNCGISEATDRDDIAQEVYISVYRNIEKLESIEAYYSWLAAIVHHSISRYYRKTNPFTFVDNSDEEIESIVEDDIDTLPEDSVQRGETRRLIEEAMKSLPTNQRMALVAFYFNGMSIKEISETTSIPENTIKTYLSRGKKALGDSIRDIERKSGITIGTIAISAFFASFFSENVYACEIPSDLYDRIENLLKLTQSDITSSGITKNDKYNTKLNIKYFVIGGFVVASLVASIFVIKSRQQMEEPMFEQPEAFDEIEELTGDIPSEIIVLEEEELGTTESIKTDIETKEEELEQIESDNETQDNLEEERMIVEKIEEEPDEVEQPSTLDNSEIENEEIPVNMTDNISSQDELVGFDEYIGFDELVMD